MPDSNQPEIKKVPFRGTFTTYEISDHDLELLKEGLIIPLYLVFALFFLSTSGSFAASFFCSNIGFDLHSEYFWFYSVVIVSTAAVGLILMWLWWTKRQVVKKIVEEIKKGPPPEGQQIK